MNVSQINDLLALGRIDKPGLWVVGRDSFRAGPVTGCTMAELLRDESW